MDAPVRSYARQANRPDVAVRPIAADVPHFSRLFARYGEPERCSVRFGHLER
jgi:hypothetical protein